MDERSACFVSADRRPLRPQPVSILGVLLAACLLHAAPAAAQKAPTTDVCLADAKCQELNQSARALAQEGQNEAALLLYQTAYARRPAAWLLISIGRLQQKLYRLPDAIKSYRQYLSSRDAADDPEMTKKAQDYLAEAESDPKAAKGEPPSELLDACLADPGCAELNDHARSLSKAGQLEAALLLYQTAHTQHPVPWLLVNIGRIQQKLNRLSDAIANYRQYLASSESKEDPELTKKTQEYLHQAEADFEPAPAALIPPPPPVPPPPPPVPLPGDAPQDGYGSQELRQKRRGLAVQLGFGSRRPVVQLDATTTEQTGSLGGSLFIGYKLNRLIFGVGFELDYFSASTRLTSPSGTSTSTASTTSYLFTPGIQLAFLRVAAGRLELLGSAQLGLGQAITNRTTAPALQSPLAEPSRAVNFHLNYQLGPGLRVFVMPRLALTLVSGLAGDHFFAAQDNPTGLRNDKLENLSIFGALSVLGVF